ncbi:hypothetical protein BDW75DRAFT_205842 [Aspergillus navahoensis]
MRRGRTLLTLVLVLAVPSSNRFRARSGHGENMEIGDRLKGKVIVLFASRSGTVVSASYYFYSSEYPVEYIQLLPVLVTGSSSLMSICNSRRDDNLVEDPWLVSRSDRG